MKHLFIIFLKLTILLIAVGTLAWIIWFPQTEGRAINLDLVSIYKDPFIMYGYIAFIPFFVGLYQTSKLLGYFDKNKLSSQPAIEATRNIKYCALVTIALVAVSVFYIRVMAHGDDPAGPTMLGFLSILACGVIATLANTFQKRLGNRSIIMS